MKDVPIILKTKILLIRALSPDEMERFTSDPGGLCSSLGYIPGETPDGHFSAACREMCAECKNDPAGYLFHTLWLAVRKEDKQLVATVGFLGSPNEFGEVEIGYGTDAPYRKNGYAYEYLTAMYQYAFSREEINYVRAQTESDNLASAQLLLKCQFSLIGEENGILTYEKEKPPSSWTSVYMCLGLAIGLAIGTATDNMAVGMSIGMLCGVALGVSLDAKEKSRRAELEKKRHKN